MTAQELRLGNWVNTPKGNARVIAVYYYKVSLQRLTEKGNFAVYDEAIEHIEPIPLTEEILLKCGFEPYGDGKLHHEELSLHEADFIFNSKSDVTKYVHQLQNLFYSLTQTELEIKL